MQEELPERSIDMGINGIGTMTSTEIYKARKNVNITTYDDFDHHVNQAEKVKAGTVKAGTSGIVLHGLHDGEEGDKLIGAWAEVCADCSVSVYKPQDFDMDNPVYRVKVWDAQGNVTERMVDISKVDPRNCDSLDMYAYSCHLTETGEYPDAQIKFMMAQAHNRDTYGSFTYENMFDRTNWLDVLKKAMDMQYTAGNLKGYMDYKKFFDFLDNRSQKSTEQEGKTDTDIVVKPDGSKVLVTTMNAGGMTTTMSIEISKPTVMGEALGRTGSYPEQAADPAACL